MIKFVEDIFVKFIQNREKYLVLRSDYAELLRLNEVLKDELEELDRLKQQLEIDAEK